MIILACGAFEGLTKIYFGVEAYQPVFRSFHLLFPDNYTISEALKAFRAALPLFLQAGLFMMDNSFDVLPAVPDDPLQILNKIVTRQNELIKMSEGILKQCKVENFGSAEADLSKVLKEGYEESDKQISDGLV